ncbi:uncharacterized protein [Epargyreus clarus]|uniref:uncharacterized protein n=1 Tax=Epargyreus clarus TaxID=520877 RepID=UPI003C2E162B
MLPLETVTGSPTEPYATRTPLGWCLHGKLMKSSTSSVAHHSTLFITDDGSAPENLNDLHEEVRRSFSIESMGISASKPRQNSEDQRAWEHLEKTSTFVDGKWYVGLPWKDTNSVMPDTYSHALARLKGVELKMKRSKEYAEKYKERIHYLLENNYAEELKDPEVTPKTWYLPHFGIENPNKKKLRVIFDAASKVAGLSLNDYLLKGPDLLMSLYGIMLRFRENRIAVAADIKDMFLRVKIRPEDRDSLRFIFRDNSGNMSDTNISEKCNSDENKIKTMS